MNEGFVGLLRLVSVAIQNAGFAVIVGALLGSHWLARGESVKNMTSRSIPGAMPP